jgi:anti-sigma B factor antagonist
VRVGVRPPDRVCHAHATGTLLDMTDSGFQLDLSNAVGTVEPFRIEEMRPAGSNAFVYVLYGEVDLHVAPELRERLNGAIDGEPENVVVDLSSVKFLDSMALGVLLGAHKRLRDAGGELELVVPSPELRRIFEITMLDEVFTLARTRQEALRAFTSSWEP